MRNIYRYRDKILKLYNELSKLKKTAPSKRGDAAKQQLDKFVECVDDLFDIAIEDTINRIRTEEDRQFLQKRSKVVLRTKLFARKFQSRYALKSRIIACNN